jgi:hypothetical protein
MDRILFSEGIFLIQKKKEIKLSPKYSFHVERLQRKLLASSRKAKITVLLHADELFRYRST